MPELQLLPLPDAAKSFSKFIMRFAQLPDVISAGSKRSAGRWTFASEENSSHRPRRYRLAGMCEQLIGNARGQCLARYELFQFADFRNMIKLPAFAVEGSCTHIADEPFSLDIERLPGDHFFGTKRFDCSSCPTGCSPFAGFSPYKPAPIRMTNAHPTATAAAFHCFGVTCMRLKPACLRETWLLDQMPRQRGQHHRKTRVRRGVLRGGPMREPHGH